MGMRRLGLVVNRALACLGKSYRWRNIWQPRFEVLSLVRAEILLPDLGVFELYFG